MPPPPPPPPPWGSNPLEPVLQTVAAFSRRLLIAPDAAPDDDARLLRPILSLSLSPPPTPPPPPPPPEVLKKDSNAAPLTKEEVGRATWMLLHTIAAQFPDEPTRQQKRDAKELMAIISRLYPCKECADHFKEVLKENPVQAGSQAEFSQWLCYVHNVVNRSLGKLIFPCQRVNARWGKLDCPERSCDLEGSNDIIPNR
uniref:Sulfhydryl oxidase n=1 Tax=Leersia perrieri TaxID=77586 RepID=A0A0D9VQZ3_9ORYZ